MLFRFACPSCGHLHYIVLDASRRMGDQRELRCSCNEDGYVAITEYHSTTTGGPDYAMVEVGGGSYGITPRAIKAPAVRLREAS